MGRGEQENESVSGAWEKEKGDSFSCNVDCSECFGQYLCGI